MEFWLIIEGEKEGPILDFELRSRIRAGDVPPLSPSCFNLIIIYFLVPLVVVEILSLWSEKVSNSSAIYFQISMLYFVDCTHDLVRERVALLYDCTVAPRCCNGAIVVIRVERKRVILPMRWNFSS